MGRCGDIIRKTNETEINLSIDLDGTGKSRIKTGIGFFDHMLTLFSRHGLFNLNVDARGDLNVDAHHTVEDTGIVLGEAIRKALGEKKSIKRYGISYVPMDEALSRVVVDVGGRPYLVFEGGLPPGRVGEMDIELLEEFFRSVAYSAGMNLHITVLYGSNTHHMAESIFKAFGRALDDATRLDGRIEGVMSTKGTL